MDLIIIEDNKIKIAEEVAKQIVEFEKEKMRMDLVEKELKEKLKEAMKEHGVSRFVGQGIYADITEIKGRETIDTKRLKEELPDIAEEYTKLGEPTERFTFKISEE